jgi:hypothetical protein
MESEVSDMMAAHNVCMCVAVTLRTYSNLTSRVNRAAMLATTPSNTQAFLHGWMYNSGPYTLFTFIGYL